MGDGMGDVHKTIIFPALSQYGGTTGGRWFRRNFSIVAPEGRSEVQAALGEAICCSPPTFPDASLTATRKTLPRFPLFGYNPHHPKADNSV